MSENLRIQLDHLPHYLGQHILLTVLALMIGLAISLPTAIAVARWRPGRWPVLATVSVIQTIPGLALLALMVFVLVMLKNFMGSDRLSAFGFLPALAALTLYSMLPILRNTVTGLLGVDAASIEAARGLGMTSSQRLWRVELPLALPVIIAGVRTAAVWVVGTATLSTPVGQASLGNYLFSGLQTQNWTAIIVGCIAAGLLAIALDQLIALLEKAAATRSLWRGGVAGLGLAVIVGGGLTPTLLDPGGGVRVGSKPFTEQYVLSDLITRQLQRHGLRVEQRHDLGSALGFTALTHNEIDVLVEYAGTVWTNYMDREDIPPGDEVLAEMERWLAEKHGVRALGTLGFENAYALAMRREQAERLGIETIDDLVAHAPEMAVGGDPEIFERPEWRSVRQAYGLMFDEQVVYDSTFMYQAVANDRVQVITAYTTDARLDVYDLVLLDDPREALPPYDAVLLLSPQAAERAELVEALRPLIGTIDMAAMRQASYMVDRDDDDKRPPAQAAAWLTKQIESNATASE